MFSHPFSILVSYWLTPTRASQVALVVKNPPANAGDLREVGSIPGSGRSPGGGHATHCSTLTWRIPWTKEPGGLQSMGSQRVRHNWGDNTHAHTPTSRRCMKSRQRGKEELCTFSYASGPQSFWQQGSVSWKTIFPQSGWRGDGFRMTQVRCVGCVLCFHYD